MTTADAEQALSVAVNRADAARVYALCLRAPFAINWATLNRVILNRWSMSGLKYVKALAWKLAQADGPIEARGVHLNS